jgi:GAF domain-containing protein
LPQVVELIRDRFNLYYVGLFLVDDIRRYAVLRAGTGEAGKVQLEQKHRLRLNQDSMIGRCILEAQAQIAQQIEVGTVLFRNPHLPDTRAELALPLSASGQTLGAMTIQSTQPTAFTADDITVLETLADQLAIAIENARFVAETRIRAENERILSQITTQLSRSLDLETILQTAVQEIGHLANVREVAIHLGGLKPPADTGEIENFVTESQHGLRIISSTQKP